MSELVCARTCNGCRAIAARRPRYLQRLVRLFRWESWDTSMNLHLIPTVTFWRHHSDDWDEDCLLRVRREVRLGVEWLFWDKSWRVWRREWRDDEARERFTDDANATGDSLPPRKETNG